MRAAAACPCRAPPAPPAAVPAHARHAVAVLPLADETGDAALAWTGTGIAEMLAASLSESSELRVLDALRVLRTLRDLKLAAAATTRRALRRLAELLEVDSLVAGSVRRAGSTVRVDLRLVSVEPRRARWTHAPPRRRERRRGRPVPPGGSLGERLRAELGAGPPRLENAGARRPPPWRRRRRTGKGGSGCCVGDSVGAAPAFERAVAADPGFAAALEGLSETYQSLGYHDKALAAAERAAEAVEPAETRLPGGCAPGWPCCAATPRRRRRAMPSWRARYPNDTEVLLDLAAAQAARASRQGGGDAWRGPPSSTGDEPGPGSCWAGTRS